MRFTIATCASRWQALEYVGVCQTWNETMGTCGTMLVLRVFAHALPVASARSDGPAPSRESAP